MSTTTLYTVGHSTRSIEEFIDLLKHFDIAQVADVRTVPKSRHNPQFGTDELAESLSTAGIKYRWFKELGGEGRIAIMCAEAVPWRCHR